SCPPLGLWPSRTGLDLSSKTSRRSPGFRACCFSACSGSSTTQDRSIHSRLTWLSCALPPYRNGVAILILRFVEAQSPGPPIPLSTLQATPRDATCKTRGQDGFAILLSCRALSSPTTCRFSPAHSDIPTLRSPMLNTTT